MMITQWRISAQLFIKYTESKEKLCVFYFCFYVLFDPIIHDSESVMWPKLWLLWSVALLVATNMASLPLCLQPGYCSIPRAWTFAQTQLIRWTSCGTFGWHVIEVCTHKDMSYIVGLQKHKQLFLQALPSASVAPVTVLASAGQSFGIRLAEIWELITVELWKERVCPAGQHAGSLSLLHEMCAWDVSARGGVGAQRRFCMTVHSCSCRAGRTFSNHLQSAPQGSWTPP